MSPVWLCLRCVGIKSGRFLCRIVSALTGLVSLGLGWPAETPPWAKFTPRRGAVARQVIWRESAKDGCRGLWRVWSRVEEARRGCHGRARASILLARREGGVHGLPPPRGGFTPDRVRYRRRFCTCRFWGSGSGWWAALDLSSTKPSTILTSMRYWQRALYR